MKLPLFALAVACSLANANAEEEPSDLPVELVKDIYPGTNSSNPIGLTLFDGKVYFAADGEGTGVELYVSDGEPDGTKLLKDINPGSGSSNPSGFVEFGGKLYFRADDGTNGAELWVTDGTAAGTTLLTDINQGSSSSSPSDFVVLGDNLVFKATTADTGTELWVTDGTADGTKLLDDIQEGSGSSSPQLRPEYKVGEELLVFMADDGVNGKSLFSTDGTQGGTTFLKDISPASGEDTTILSRSLDSANDKIYFSLGPDLWATDGTPSGTKLVQENVSIGGASRISPYTLDGKTLFFGSQGNETLDNLWETDGTQSGTKILFNGLESTEKNRGASSTFGIGFGPVIDGTISLLADNGVGVNIYVTDGATVRPLIEATFTWVLAVKPSRDGSQVFFLMKNDTALDLWVSDYTQQNTERVATFPDGISSSVGEAVALDETLALFTVSSPEYGVELWKMQLPEMQPTRTRPPDDDPDSRPTRAPTTSRPDPPEFESSGAVLPPVVLASALAFTVNALNLV